MIIVNGVRVRYHMHKPSPHSIIHDGLLYGKAVSAYPYERIDSCDMTIELLILSICEI